MEKINNCLDIEPRSACRKIESFIKLKLQELRKEGGIIGLSGGFDSSLVACLSVKALGREKVRLINLPDRDSKSIHQRHARLLADQLGITLEVKNITSILNKMGVYNLLPTSRIPVKAIRNMTARVGMLLLGLQSGKSILDARFSPKPNSLIAKGKAYAMVKHRVRMLLLYQQAETSNLMVIGAANRTELMTGTFSQWGCDQCADVMPIVHLYRSQLYPLAEYLHLPKCIINKAAEPDIIPGLPHKEELLGSFAVTDQILFGLENGVSKKELVSHHGVEAVDQIINLVELSKPMRESPYIIPLSEKEII